MEDREESNFDHFRCKNSFSDSDDDDLDSDNYVENSNKEEIKSKNLEPHLKDTSK